MENQIILFPALAELTLAGVNPVVGLKERPTEFLKRLPIFSSGEVFNYDMPIEFIMEGHNQIVFGNIPPINDMAEESIIGVVEVGCKADEKENKLWRSMLQGDLYHVIDCFIFEIPIKNEPLNLIRLNADELLKVFPFHRLTLKNGLKDLGSSLKIEMGKQHFWYVSIFHELTLDLTLQVREVVLDEDGNLKNFNYLWLTCDNKEKHFEFKAEIKMEHNGKDEPMLFNSVFEPCGKNTRAQIVFDCSSQLFW